MKKQSQYYNPPLQGQLEFQLNIDNVYALKLIWEIKATIWNEGLPQWISAFTAVYVTLFNIKKKISTLIHSDDYISDISNDGRKKRCSYLNLFTLSSFIEWDSFYLSALVLSLPLLFHMITFYNEV